MTPHDTNLEGGADLAADLIMGTPHPSPDLPEQAATVMDRLALEAHQQISGVDQHWQIAIHLWPALKTIASHTRLPSGHMLAAGVDADMLAGHGPHPHYPRDPQRHLVFHTPIPPTSQWPHHDLPLHELGAQDDPGRYDLVVANLPYHDAALLDPGRRARLGAYHQELLNSALEQTTPGGIAVALTSPVFLDHPAPGLRRHVADKADLLGAVRLPGGAMRPDSHAEGPTDVLILRRRPDQNAGLGIPAAVEAATALGRGHLNAYWLDHPDHVLGHLRYDPDSAVFTVDPGREPLGRSLQVAFDQIATAMVSELQPGTASRTAPEHGPHRAPDPTHPSDIPGP